MSAHKTLNTFVVYFKALFFLRYGHSTITAVWTDGLNCHNMRTHCIILILWQALTSSFPFVVTGFK